MNKFQRAFAARPMLTTLAAAPLMFAVYAGLIYRGSWLEALISSAAFTLLFCLFFGLFMRRMLNKSLVGLDLNKRRRLLLAANEDRLDEEPELIPQAKVMAEKNLALLNRPINKWSVKYLPYIASVSAAAMLLLNLGEGETLGIIFWSAMIVFWLTAIYWFPRPQKSSRAKMQLVLDQASAAEAASRQDAATT